MFIGLLKRPIHITKNKKLNERTEKKKFLETKMNLKTKSTIWFVPKYPGERLSIACIIALEETDEISSELDDESRVSDTVFEYMHNGDLEE